MDEGSPVVWVDPAARCWWTLFWRSFFLTGSGFFAARRYGAAILVMLPQVLFVASLVAFMVSFSGFFWIVVWITLVLWGGCWITEIIVAPKFARPGLVVRPGLVGFVCLVAVVYAIINGLCVSFLIGVRSYRIMSDGMAPTVAKGELCLSRLESLSKPPPAGTVILFHVAPTGPEFFQGNTIISRVLAGPGDRVSIFNGRYLVNGQLGPPVGDLPRDHKVLPVPADPESIQVPNDSCFVVQDKFTAYDSRAFGWVRAQDIVSTKLMSLTGQPVK